MERDKYLSNESDTGATRHRGLIADTGATGIGTGITGNNPNIDPLPAASVTRTVHGLESIEPLLDQLGSAITDRLNDDTTYPRNTGVNYSKANPEQWFYSVHRVSSPATATFTLPPGASGVAGNVPIINIDYTGPSIARTHVNADFGVWIFSSGTLDFLQIEIPGINQDANAVLLTTLLMKE